MLLRFTGSNGSMGLRTGSCYRVAVEPRGPGILMTRPVRCPYGSDEAFWKNWEVPNHEKEMRDRVNASRARTAGAAKG